MRFLTSGLFTHKLSSLIIPLAQFRIFRKLAKYICNSRCTTVVSDTGGKLITGVNNACGHTFSKTDIDRLYQKRRRQVCRKRLFRMNFFYFTLIHGHAAM